MDSSAIIELQAAVQVGEEVKDARALAHVETIRARHAAATPGPWYPVDLRHRQQGGQVRLFAKGAHRIIANVLRSGANAGPDGQMLGHAWQDIGFLLAEVARLRGTRAATPTDAEVRSAWRVLADRGLVGIEWSGLEPVGRVDVAELLRIGAVDRR